jgi:hypothetical protein
MTQIATAASPPAPGSVTKADRKLYVLLDAIAVMAVIDLLPSPPPLVRAGNLIPLTTSRSRTWRRQPCG